MGSNLLVAGGNETDPALAQGIQERDYGVAAETKDDLHTQLLQIFREQVGGNSRFGCPVAKFLYRCGVYCVTHVLETSSS
jgi:hypothetical protein